MAAPRRPRGRFLLLVLVLLGVTLITLSDRNSSEGIFNKVRSYAATWPILFSPTCILRSNRWGISFTGRRTTELCKKKTRYCARN